MKPTCYGWHFIKYTGSETWNNIQWTFTGQPVLHQPRGKQQHWKKKIF